MTNHSIKVGPQRIQSTSDGLKCSWKLILQIGICTIFMELLIGLGRGLRYRTQEHMTDFFFDPVNILLLCFVFLATALGAFNRARSLAHFYIDLGETSLQVFEKHGLKPPKIVLEINYSEFQSGVFSVSVDSHLYYKRSGFSMFGLPSHLHIGVRSREELDQIRRSIQKVNSDFRIFNSNQERLSAQ